MGSLCNSSVDNYKALSRGRTQSRVRRPWVQFPPLLVIWVSFEHVTLTPPGLDLLTLKMGSLVGPTSVRTEIIIYHVQMGPGRSTRSMAMTPSRHSVCPLQTHVHLFLFLNCCFHPTASPLQGPQELPITYQINFKCTVAWHRLLQPYHLHFLQHLHLTRLELHSSLFKSYSTIHSAALLKIAPSGFYAVETQPLAIAQVHSSDGLFP